MKIDLEKIEKLAALRLSGKEKERIGKDLEEIIAYLKTLKKLKQMMLSRWFIWKKQDFSSGKMR